MGVYFFTSCASDYENSYDQQESFDFSEKCHVNKIAESCAFVAEKLNESGRFAEAYIELQNACQLKHKPSCDQVALIKKGWQLQKILDDKTSDCLNKKIIQTCLDMADYNYRTGRTDDAASLAGKACILNQIQDVSFNKTCCWINLIN